MKISKRDLAIIVTLVIFGMLFGVKKINKNKPQRSINYSEVKKGDIESHIEAKGQVAASKKISIYEEYPQKIQQITKKVGDLVKQGETLIYFSPEYKSNYMKKIESEKLECGILISNLKELEIPLNKFEIEEKKYEINEIERESNKLQNQKENLEKRLILSMKKLKQSREQLKTKNELYSKKAINKSELNSVISENLEVETQYISEELELKNLIIEIAKNKQTFIHANEQLKNLESEFDKQLLKKELEIQNQNRAIRKQELLINRLEREYAKIKTEIKSPINGIVSYRKADVGDILESGARIFEILDSDSLSIRADIPEYEISNITIGQKIKIDADNLDEMEGFVNNISGVSKEVYDGTLKENIIEIEVMFLNKNANIRPGNRVTLEIQKEKKEDIIVIPKIAIQNSRDKKSVLIVNDNVVERKEIKTGAFSITDIEITEGLSEGDRVVVFSNTKLENGMKIDEGDLSDSN